MVEVGDKYQTSPPQSEDGGAPPPIRSKTMKAVGWSTVGMIGGRVISLVLFMVLTRLLDTHSLGLLQLGTLVIAFVQAFATQGFADALIQREKLTEEHLNSAFWLNLFVGSILTIATMLLSDDIARICEEPELAAVIWWLSLSFVLYGISSIQRTMLMRNLDFSLPSMIMLASDVLGGLVGIAMALAGMGVWSLVAQFMTTRVVYVILFTIWTPWWPGLKMSWQAVVELYSFGLKIMLIRNLEFFNQRLPDILVKAFFGTDALGLYSVASRLLVAISQTVTSVMAPVAFVSTSRLQNDPERVSRGFYSGSELIGSMTAPAFIGIALVSPTLLPYLFGDHWRPIVPIAQWLTVTAMVQATTLDLCAIVLMGVGKPSQTIISNVLFSTLQVLAFVGTALMGGNLTHVAAATAFSALIAVPMVVGLVGRSVPVSLAEYLRRVSRPMLAALAMSPVVWPAVNYLENVSPRLVGVVVPILLGAVVYIGALSLLNPGLVRQIMGVGLGLVRRLRPGTP